METWSGYVERIVYRAPDTGYTVLEVTVGGDSRHVTGQLADVEAGEFIDVTGKVIVHPLYGEQMAASGYAHRIPQDPQLIARYLGSGMIKGVGEVMASRIVKRFGEDTMRIIEEEPERLAEIKGISLKSALLIGSQAARKKDQRDALMFLQQYGISPKLALKIYTTYGEGTYRIMRENPYRLTEDVYGIGFRTADEIASRVGFSADSEYRIRSGLEYVLQEAEGNGHTCLPVTDLIAEAADILGVRMHFSRGSMDRSQKDGGLPPDSVVQTVDEILADSQRIAERWHDPAFGSLRRVALAPCSPFSVSETLLRESAKLARALGLRLHTHLCETLDEERYTLETDGLRPLAYMETVDWLGPDVWYAHGIHFNDGELRLLAETGTGICHCPVSNMKLSSGTARVPELLRLGVPVGLGVDGSASNDGSNLLEELRVCYLLHRLVSGDAAPPGYDVLKMATGGGARLLGREAELGSLEVGKCADFFLLRKNRLELAGACRDPKALLATVGLKGPVDYTVVNGRVTVENGRLAGIDEERLVRDAEREVARYLGGL